jgi:hypothetical protein
MPNEFPIFRGPLSLYGTNMIVYKVANMLNVGFSKNLKHIRNNNLKNILKHKGSY